MDTGIHLELTFDERDEFNRRSKARKIAMLLRSEVDVSPILLSGPWGSGKSEFCIKLCNLFRHDHTDYRVAYIDAFQSDLSDEPLVAILGALSQLLTDDEESYRGYLKKAAPVAKAWVKGLSKACLSLALKEYADHVENEIEEAVAEVGENAIERATNKLIRDHAKVPDNIQSLKKCLMELAEDRPIILFVDELDRCRPDFAVELLESIKHIFDVPGVKFFLVANLEKLESSVMHRYGEHVDAQLYLDKFFKYIFGLSYHTKDSGLRDISNSELMLLGLVKSSALVANAESDGVNSVIDTMRTLILLNRCSLRDVEKIVRCMQVFDVIKSSKDIRLLPAQDESVASFTPSKPAGRYTMLRHHSTGMVHALAIFLYATKRHLIDEEGLSTFSDEIASVIDGSNPLDISLLMMKPMDVLKIRVMELGGLDLDVQVKEHQTGWVSHQLYDCFALDFEEVNKCFKETIEVISLV